MFGALEDDENIMRVGCLRRALNYPCHPIPIPEWVLNTKLKHSTPQKLKQSTDSAFTGENDR